jgi:hypothetical protein
LLRTVGRAALLAVLVAAACAPAGDPIIAPVPTGGPELASAPRPFVRPVPVPEEFRQALERGTRSPTGAPGAGYWQQRVSYRITATLNPADQRLEGRQRIVYHNRSPDALDQVVLNLYQNLFTETFVGTGTPFNTGGLSLTRLAVRDSTLGPVTRQQFETALREGRRVTGYMVEGTIGRVLLPQPLASGDSLWMDVDWNFRVPPAGAPRTAWEDALGGRVFQVAQWYPQIAVYDDVEGWNVSPYRGQGEFYLEYGDFDVTLDLPAGWIVGATGTLQNPEAVLTSTARERIARAARSDSAVAIVTREEMTAGQGTAAGTNGRVTWRFTAADVRDFGFAASNRYVWDAVRASIPDGAGGTRAVLVHALYRPGAPHWEQAIRYGQHSTAFLSELLVPYAYPQVTIAEGSVYGMEYPMLTFIGRPPLALGLYEVIAHEIGHQWYPMMVGQDEAAYAWMDEGTTTYVEAQAVQDFWPDATPFRQPRQAYLAIAGQRAEAPLMQHADLVAPAAFGVAGYYKPALVLRALRRVLGDEVYYRALRTYTTEWTFRKPTPWDFFNTFERVSGRDLDWFFYPWMFRTETFDQAVGPVRLGTNEVTVEVRDLGQVPGPTTIVATNREGQTFTGTISIDDWLQPGTRVRTVTIPTTGEVVRVEIDPEEWFPDVNRRNNVWTP